MKKISIIILLVVFLGVFISCNNSSLGESTQVSEDTFVTDVKTDESETETDKLTFPRYTFSSYEEFFDAFDISGGIEDVEKNKLQMERNKYGAYNRQFIVAMTMREKIEVPHMNGEPIPVNDITYFVEHGDSGGHPLILYKLKYMNHGEPCEIEIKAINSYASSSILRPHTDAETLWKAVNFHGHWSSTFSGAANDGVDISREVELKNETVILYDRALYPTYFDMDKMDEVTFYTNGWLIEVSSPKGVLTDEFWSSFSFE